MSEESQGELPESSQDAEATDSEPKGSKSIYIYNQIDQEMADAYGWTPQQARESQLYL
jgi:hypothetical protein